MLVMGSCFAENIGEKLTSSKFHCVVNPTGVLYNPLSIASVLERLLHGEKTFLVSHDEKRNLWFSWMHDTKFDAEVKSDCVKNIENKWDEAVNLFSQVDILLITLGTNHTYYNKETNQIVSNCHKQPSGLFIERIVEIDEIVDKWQSILLPLINKHPHIKVLFTVSPIRYAKYGFHESQLSKASLLLAVNKLQKEYPQHCFYFPAYELVCDELRDYRFYSEDMLHPSAQTVQYIWEKFTECYFNDDCMLYLKLLNEVQRGLTHKPFRADSESYHQFLVQIVLKIEQLKKKYPNFAFNKEIELCHTLLQR